MWMKLYLAFLDNEKTPPHRVRRGFRGSTSYAPATTATETLAVTAWPSETFTV